MSSTTPQSEEGPDTHSGSVVAVAQTSNSQAAHLAPVLTPQGWDLLNSLPEYSADTAWETNTALRKQGWPPETVASVLTQLKLRKQARTKFGPFAARMLFTDAGLQQATRLPAAARHAQRFRTSGVTRVVDLGCGLGADALAFASAGLDVTAVEADETTAAAATVNLHPFPEAQVVHTTAEEFVAAHVPGDASVESGLGLWLDPARRDSSSRVWDPEAFSPPLSFAVALASTGIPLGVKLGPGIPHHLIPNDCEAEWVSVDGNLVEVVLWFNAAARPGVRRSATVLRSSGNDPLEVTTAELSSPSDFGAGLAPEPAGPDGLTGLLCEPDPAVIRAELVAELCNESGGHLLDEKIAYFCCPEPQALDSPAASMGRLYRVEEVMDFNVKTLNRWVKSHDITSVEIMKRGVDVIPETLRRQILPGSRRQGSSRHALIVITRIGQRRLAAAVEPVS